MKKTKKMVINFLAIIATIAIVLTSTLHVKAAADQITLGDSKMSGKYIAGVYFGYKVTTDGKYLYCVDMNKDTAKNIKADLVKNSSVINGGLVHILKNGYPEKSITGDADKDYYITQTAVWWYLDETTGSHNLGEYFKVSGSDTYGLRKYVKNLVDEGIAHKNDAYGTSSSSFKITTTGTGLTLSGDYYVSNAINISQSGSIQSYTVKLSGAPEGTIIESGSKSITGTSATFSGTSSFKIKVPASKVTDSISIKVTTTATGATQYTAYEYQPQNKNMQNVALLEKTQQNFSSSITLNAEVEEESKVTVVKIDANTKQPLAGAVLVLKDENGKELTRWTSTTNAHVIKNLANGTYTVEEISAPSGYKLNKNVSKFTISNTNRNIKINFENAPNKIVVNITKVDQETQQPLAGAVLVIKDENGEVVYKFTTTNSSEVITDIEYGTYTVEEISAPDGYIKSDEKVTFTIDDNHLSHQIVFENAKEVYVPDTASVPSMIMIILGIVITGFGLKFVYKNGQKTR